MNVRSVIMEHGNEMKNMSKNRRIDYTYSSSLLFDTIDEVNQWIKEHIKEQHDNELKSETVCCTFDYQFTSNSIGLIGIIKCSCGMEHHFCELS